MIYMLNSLYVLGLYGAFMAGSIYFRKISAQANPPSRTISFHFPRATILLFIVVGMPSVLQFFYPGMLVLFQRDFTRFLQGEWWRLVTPLFVQDGGLAGTSFNLTSLLLVGFLAEQFWGSLPVLLIFFLGGIAGEIAGFAWQPLGAGNSVANFALAGSILALLLLRRPDKLVLFISLAVLSSLILLIGLYDIHGVAGTAGVCLGLMLGLVFQRKFTGQSSGE